MAVRRKPPKRFASVVVDTAKLRDYCLSPTHPRGRHKARVFRSRLGLTANDADRLREALLSAVSDFESLQASETDVYGERFVVDFAMSTDAGTAAVRSTWIVLAGEDVLRLATCYVI